MRIGEETYERLYETLYGMVGNYGEQPVISTKLARWGKRVLQQQNSEILFSGISEDMFAMGYFTHILQNVYHDEFKFQNITQGLYDTFNILHRLIRRLESKIDYEDDSISTYEMVIFLEYIQSHMPQFMSTFLNYNVSSPNLPISTSYTAVTLDGKELSFQSMRLKLEPMYDYHVKLNHKLKTFKESLTTHLSVTSDSDCDTVTDFVMKSIKLIVSHEFVMHDKGYRYFSDALVALDNKKPTYSKEYFRESFVNPLLQLMLSHVDYCVKCETEKHISVLPVLIFDYITMSLRHNYVLTVDGMYEVKDKYVKGHQAYS